MLIQPVCKGRKLYQEIKEAKEFGSKNSFDVWWLGQSGFLIQWNHKCLLLDPYLSDSLTKKYAATDKPHVRVSELVIEPGLLDGIDVVTSSHNHTDHLDAETLIPILNLNPDALFLIPEANRSFVADRVKCDSAFPTGLNDGEKIAFKEFTFHGVPAAHNTIERDENGRAKFMGYVIHFGEFNIYHSGDTLWYDDIVDQLKPFNVDVAFLPINGNDPSRGVAGNLNCEEAARLGSEIKARWVVP
ncbi:MAG TPA: MBL fold metallo-hydrolase, partial [Chryseolinea sp.]